MASFSYQQFYYMTVGTFAFDSTELLAAQPNYFANYNVESDGWNIGAHMYFWYYKFDEPQSFGACLNQGSYCFGTWLYYDADAQYYKYVAK